MTLPLPRAQLERFGKLLSEARRRNAKAEQSRRGWYDENGVRQGGLIAFVRYFWHILEPETPFVDGWPIWAICEHLEAVTFGEITRLLINVPPGFAKSILVDVFWPAWEWGPIGRSHYRYVAFSYSASLTERDNDRFRTIIVSREFQALYGPMRTSAKQAWGKDEKDDTPKAGVGLRNKTTIKVMNTHTGWKLASSVHGIGTGERGDRIICLRGDAVVQTPNGKTTISELVDSKREREVLGFDHGTNSPRWQKITAYESNPSRRLVRIRLEGGELVCTPDHPIWIAGRGYTQAQAVRKGQKALRILAMSDVRQAVGEETVCSVEWLDEESPVYNVRVEPDHNYFANGFLTHNCDDPHNVVEAESEIVRNDTVRWFRESISSRFNNLETGALVVIMQRVHEDDVSGVILSLGFDYCHLMIPWEYDAGRQTTAEGDPVRNTLGWHDPRCDDEDGAPAWPERFNPDAMTRTRQELGPYAWAAQYQQAPSPRGGGIFKRSWWQLWDSPDGKFPVFEYLLASLDSAFTEKEENDPSALTVWGVFGDDQKRRRIMLVHAWRKHLQFSADRRLIEPGPEGPRYLWDGAAWRLSPKWARWRRETMEHWGLMEWVDDTCNAYKVDKLLIEAKASGISCAQELQNRFGQQNWAVQLCPVSGDKVARALSVQPTFSQQMVYAPSRDWAEMVIDEMSVFPKGKYKDLTDSTTQAIRHLRDGGLAMSDQEAAVEEAQAVMHRPARKPLYPV